MELLGKVIAFLILVTLAIVLGALFTMLGWNYSLAEIFKGSVPTITFFQAALLNVLAASLGASAFSSSNSK